jgi:hypothetical protein
MAVLTDKQGNLISGCTTQIVTTIGSANAVTTLTLPAAGAGLSHYITRIEIVRINPTITAVAAAASLLAITTTNLPGSVAWSLGNAIAAGAHDKIVDMTLESPIKSSAANTNTTIVTPAGGAGVQFRVTVYYFIDT